MAKEKSENVYLGVGYFYIIPWDGTVPEDEALEIDDNKIGHTDGGAELQYTTERKEHEDDNGYIVINKLTKESVLVKTGALSWGPETLEMMCETAEIEESSDFTTVKFGGLQNARDKSYLIRFVHTKTDGSKLRLSVRGVPNEGFTLAFKKEDVTVIDMPFKALPLDDEGRLFLIKTEKTKIPISK